MPQINQFWGWEFEKIKGSNKDKTKTTAKCKVCNQILKDSSGRSLNIHRRFKFNSLFIASP